MENDQAEKRRKGYVLMRSVMDFGMGLVILGFGVFFLASPYIGVGFTVEPFSGIFLALCVLSMEAGACTGVIKKNITQTK